MPSGSKPGERRGGREKGARNKSVVAEEERKLALLSTVKEIYEDQGYDPLGLAVAIALRKSLRKNDYTFFQMHMALAKKYYPDVGMVTVRGDAENPVVFQSLESKLNDGLQRRNEARNGHARTVARAD